MKLEAEIKQLKFSNEYQKAAANIIFTSNWINAIQSRSLKKYSLTPEQFQILKILKGQYPSPSTVTLLVERMLNKMSNASRLVEKLFKKKFVERRQAVNDRRAVDIKITKKGLSLLSELEKVENYWHEVIANISSKEAKKLNELLNKLRG